jgi:hypothetical protein
MNGLHETVRNGESFLIQTIEEEELGIVEKTADPIQI